MSSEKEYSEEQLEAGRLLFARPWEFITSVKEMHQLPVLDGIEIAFAGRSNVGKSSLINKLTGKKALARTSNTPGRTQMLNFFGAEHSILKIVDMPAMVMQRHQRGWWTHGHRSFLTFFVAEAHCVVCSR